MPTFAASLESLIAFAVILLLSAVGNWIKSRNARSPDDAEERERPAAPGRPRPGQPETPAPRPPAGFDWERELRRMFGEEPEPQRPAPPPPSTTVPPRMPPTAAPQPSHPHASPTPVTTARSEPASPSKPSWRRHDATEDAPALDHADAPTANLATLSSSRVAYDRARALQAATQARLEAVKARVQGTAKPTEALTGSASADVAALVRSFRNPRTARQAMLAAVILGPAKATTP